MGMMGGVGSVTSVLVRLHAWQIEFAKPMDRQDAIAELQRVAALLDTQCLSRSMFAKHATLSSATIESTFGTWNEAIVAAGLLPLPQGGLPKAEQRRIDRLARPHSGNSPAQEIPDNDLLDDLLRLEKELGRRPEREFWLRGRRG
jgi:hypothetical protein